MNDNRVLKYIDVGHAFNSRASQIDLFCKQSQRICELLAVRLAAKKPKTPAEFENNEYWKQFILKTSSNNQATIELLAYMKEFLQDVVDDSTDLMDVAKLRDTIQFQADTIKVQTGQYNDLFQELGKYKKDEISRRDTANIK